MAENRKIEVSGKISGFDIKELKTGYTLEEYLNLLETKRRSKLAQSNEGFSNELNAQWLEIKNAFGVLKRFNEVIKEKGINEALEDNIFHFQVKRWKFKYGDPERIS